jgi:hypothetical protein
MDKEVELQMLIMEHNACAHERRWDRVAAKKMRAGEICSSCRRPLPPPHTPECKRCALCAGSHHVRMTFFYLGGWHCQFYTERWRPLPKRLKFRKAASVIETAVRGNGLIEDGARAALERSLKIGRGGLILRLSDTQFKVIADAPPPAPGAADDKAGTTEDIPSEAGSSPDQP